MARAHFQVLAIPFRFIGTAKYEFAIFKRSDMDCWQGIAGGGEDNETPLQAMKREALEEAGIPETVKYYRLKTFASIPVYCFGASKYWPKDLYVIPEFSFAIDCTEYEISLSPEHSDYKWVDYTKAKDLLRYDSNRTALWEILERLKNDDLK